MNSIRYEWDSSRGKYLWILSSNLKHLCYWRVYSLTIQSSYVVGWASWQLRYQCSSTGPLLLLRMRLSEDEGVPPQVPIVAPLDNLNRWVVYQSVWRSCCQPRTYFQRWFIQIYKTGTLEQLIGKQRKIGPDWQSWSKPNLYRNALTLHLNFVYPLILDHLHLSTRDCSRRLWERCLGGW